jgi:gluconate 2-dehydrogenase gamma chain
MEKITRRIFLKTAGAAAITGTAELPSAAAAQTPPRAPYTFLNAQEAAFIEAAVERLIPHDETGPGALDAGVPAYIDKQLAGAWGAGERLYRSGPWQQGAPTQGYQLPFTPAELFRNALRAVTADFAGRGTSFAKLAPAEQDTYLKSLETGKQDLGGVPANVFFDSLLAMTIEGYFSDPVYGGNTGMVAWRMIGFPGAYANFYELVDQHGIKYTRRPISMADDGHGHVQTRPNIPAYQPSEAAKKGKR